jgi:uncharacterized delta-60 repeat protein
MHKVRPRLAIAVLGVSAIVLPTPALATPGDLDPAFGTDGEVAGVTALDLVIQPDGSIVTAGPDAIYRFESDGTPDPSFGGDGHVVSWPSAQAVVLQPHGRIVVAGSRGDKVALARYLSNGILDVSFSDDGRASIDLGTQDDIAFGVALTSAGQIVAAVTGTGRAYVLRYRRNGKLDRTFSGDGIARAPIKGSGTFQDVLVQPDDKIVAAGTADGRLLLARYRPSGKLDPTFGSHGIVIARLGEFSVSGAALQPNGKIVVVGYCFRERWLVCLARFRPSGVIDGSFGGGDGRVITSLGPSSFGEDVALQSDGKIVVVGSLDDQVYAVIRYDVEGSLDPGFGSGGSVLTETDPYQASARAVAIQDDGRLVVGGFSSLLRYLA